uniref:Uncharacterized protein n=1 Tax=Anguilla anguilla TaxID=7936 RepID=A0A0E9XIP6_ANGAN
MVESPLHQNTFFYQFVLVALNVVLCTKQLSVFFYLLNFYLNPLILFFFFFLEGNILMYFLFVSVFNLWARS